MSAVAVTFDGIWCALCDHLVPRVRQLRQQQVVWKKVPNSKISKNVVIMKKRRFYYISWASIIWTLILVPICCESANKNEDELFIFPSMKMESISANSGKY